MENSLSLAAIEAELKPKVVETFDNIADAYKRLRRLQDQDIQNKLHNDSLSPAQERRLRILHLLEVVAQLERVVEAALVRDQHRHRHRVRDVGPAQYLGAVRKLGDHVGADEARDLQSRNAGAGEQLDQAHLVVGGDDLGLVLEPVARSHLADRDHRHEASY